MNTSLILVIENSKTNLGAGKYWENKEYTRDGGEPLEEEAIECVKSWRQYYPKGIDIYCVCPSKRVPERKTIDQLKEYDVTYIEKYFPETEKFTCGYWNVPLVCAWIEPILYNNILIHTDLDMRLINLIPFVELLKYNSLTIARVGALPNEDRKDIHIFQGLAYDYESNFIISRGDDFFYHDWLKELKELEKIHSDPTWHRYAELEEFAIDSLSRYDCIEPMQYYQVGPRYRAKDIPDEKLDQIYFIHRHPYESNEEYGRYLKRYLKWKK